MRKRLKMKATITLELLLIAFSVFSLTGCTTLKNMANWVPSRDSENNIKGIEDKDLAQFASSLRPLRGDLHSMYKLGCYFQERKKHHLAVAEFRKVVRIDPTHVKAYNGLGVSYDKLGKFPRAIQAYNTALALNPGLDYVQNNLGYSYLLQGDFDSAIESFQKAITLNSTNKRYHNNLGMAYARNSQFDLAFQEFKLAGGEAKAHNHIAQFYYQNGLYQEAKIHFAKASSINPSDRGVRSGLAAAENLSRITQSKNKKPAETAPAKIEAEVKKGVFAKYDDEMPSAITMAGEERMESREIETRLTETVKKTPRNDRADAHHSHLTGAFKAVEYSKSEKKGNLRGSIQNKETDPEHKIGNIHKFKVAASSNNEFSEPELSEEPEAAEETKAPKAAFLGYITTQETIKPGLSERTFDTIKSYSLSDLSLEISNGNGVRHMARRVGNLLIDEGFEKPHLTNASHFNHSETKIYYCIGYLQEAYRVAQEIPGYQNMEKVDRLERPEIKVKVLIGKDLILFDDLFMNRYWNS